MQEQFLPYEPSSATSKNAARSMRGREPSDRQRVHEFLAQRGEYGATDEEIEEALGLRHQTASARRRGLCIKHKVRDSGATRATSSGRQATVWVCTVRP